MPGGLAPVERQAVLLLVVFELISLLLLVFGDRLPTASLTRGAAAVLAPANGVVRWVESVARAKSDATKLRAEVATAAARNDHEAAGERSSGATA